MKKVSATCLILVSIFSLAACDQEKAYDYEAFKEKVAKKEFKLEYSKAHAKIKLNSEESERNYTYNKTDGTWYSTYEKYDEATGKTDRYTSSVILELKVFIENADASLEGWEIDKMNEIATFYIKKDQYRVVEDYELDNKLHQSEMRFNKEGLMVYYYSYVKDNKAGTFREETVEYSYYK